MQAGVRGMNIMTMLIAARMNEKTSQGVDVSSWNVKSILTDLNKIRKQGETGGFYKKITFIIGQSYKNNVTEVNLRHII